MPIIMHVDMDSFFASVEINEKPELLEKPLVICVYSGRDEDSGAVATANYIARKYGVGSGLPIKFAKKMLVKTDAVFLPLRKDYYQDISTKIMRLIENYVDELEIASIDEAYCDMSSTKSFDEAGKLSMQIKEEIKKEFGLRCSIGIANTKVVAKIASDFNKPDGLTIVEDAVDFLSDLPIRKIGGLGPKAQEKLREFGIEKISDIRTFGKSKMCNLFGETLGTKLFEYANGIDDRKVLPHEKKQLHRIFTLSEDSRDIRFIHDNIMIAYGMVRDRAKKQFKTISLILVSDNLSTHTKSKTFDTMPSEKQVSDATSRLLSSFLEKNNDKLRRVGFGISNFYEQKEKSLSEYT